MGKTYVKKGEEMEDKLEKLKKKNDLSDIILEKDSSSGDNIKKLLLGAASLVLLFLIGLIAMKMFNSSNISESESLANVGENVEQVNETIVDRAKDAVEKSEDSLFKEAPIIDETSETDLKFEEMVRKLKQQDALENQESTVKDVDKELNAVLDEPKESKTVKEENVVDKIKEVASKPIKKVEEKVIKVAKPITEKVIATTTPVVKTKPKEIVVSTKPAYTPAPVTHKPVTTQPVTTSSSISSLSGYFIQVGATSKSFPDRRFLQKIKNSGYDYIVHKVVVKGRNIKKVLVGPYSTRAQARADLPNVQSAINPSAYIFRIK
jgi:DedD protein